MVIQVPPPKFSKAEWDAFPMSERIAQLNAYLCDTLKVHEQPKGSNAGPEVNLFLKFAGLDPGFAWCIAMQVWVAMACGVPEADLPPQSMRASTVQVLHWARAQGKAFETPERGDWFIHVDPDGQHGHAGCYLAPVLDDSFRSIEGNTNLDGSSEGWEVCRHARNLNYAAGFVRLW